MQTIYILTKEDVENIVRLEAAKEARYLADQIYSELSGKLGAKLLSVGTSDSITLLGLSVRPENCLGNMEIRTIAQLISKTGADLLKIRNLGRRSLEEIRIKLMRHGLSLAQESEEC